MKRRIVAMFITAALAVTALGFSPAPVAAGSDWSFEGLPTDSGWEIEVEAGSGHGEGDCTDSGFSWLTLEPVEGDCFVQFSQEMPSAFALHHALPGGKHIVFRHIDNQAPFLFAIDSVSLDGNEFRFTMASQNFDDSLGYRFEDDSWTLEDGTPQQKMALYVLSAEPANWFDIDPAIVQSVLLSPGEMEVDHDGLVNDGDTDGVWAERVCNLRTGTCDGDNGDLEVTLYDDGGRLDPWGSRPRPWEANGLREFTKCDQFNVETINADWGDGQPFERYNCNDDHFVARYSGTITVPVSGNYTFTKSSDDGLTVFIDGAMVINEWGLHGMDRFVGETIYLEAGRAYSLEAWFFDGCCGAGAILLAGIGEPQIIPATWLGGGGDPSIMSLSGRKLVGSTTAFASSRVRWAWMRCTSAGSSGVSRRLPRTCSIVQRGAGLGSSLARRPYVMSGSDRFLRLAIYSGGTWHYSGTYEAP